MILRKVRLGDAEDTAGVLLNDFTAIGGITAHESLLTVAEPRHHLDGPDGPALRDGRVVGRVDKWFSLV